MKIRRHSRKYNFIGDTLTGTTFRWGESFEKNPKYAPWPELADISISNHCTNNCDFCYRDSKLNYSFMSLSDYEYLIKQLKHPHWGNVFQIALGGGEPLQHPDFIEIINITKSYGIIPNFTTNGKYLTADMIIKLKGKVGAIAISTTDIKMIHKDTIIKLKKADITCNIHYVLNYNNLKQAIEILNGEHNQYIQDINSTIFLTYKPLGRADNSRVLKIEQDFLNFVSIIEYNLCSTRIGFDACFVPMLMYYTNVDLTYIDPCECAFFSVYIDEKLNMRPCSFSDDEKFTYSVKEYSVEHIWTVLFKSYRDSLTNKCIRSCKNKTECRGCCSYFDNITMCYLPEKPTELSYENTN